jgi:sulfite reductase beta subunit
MNARRRTMSPAPRCAKPVECGVPDNKPHLHPTLLKNYGNWKYHDRPRPGVLHHVSHTGEEIWTVRAGTQRQMDVYTIRKLCDIADKFAEGFVRFTIRSNIEFMVADEKKVAPLIAELEKNGFPVGGTGNSVSMVSHTQGWLHCDIPGTDASGVVKSMMDELYNEFIHEEMPNRVRLSTSCCEINCGGQADIAIIIQHTKPPKINHDLVANVCERPTVVARCPVAAIRPALVNGKPSLEVDEKKCICCGACFPPARPCRSTIRSIPSWRSGSAARTPTPAASRTFMKMVASGLPNNAPRWPEVRRGRQHPAHLQGRRPPLGAPRRLDRPHRLAALLRKDRPALHQVPDRRLAWFARQPQRFDPHPLLSALQETCS